MTSAQWPVLVGRLALGLGFLSAVADRFGLYGPPGTPGVAWGNFASFTSYTGVVNRFAPSTLVPLFAWTATLAELVLGTMLLLGFFTRYVAFASGVLLMLFGLGMATGIRLKSPLDYSVFSAAAAAFLLAQCARNDAVNFFATQ